MDSNTKLQKGNNTEPHTPSEKLPESPSETLLGKPKASMSLLRWSHISPFFLSAVFFLSRFFIIFAPMPILAVYMLKGRRWAWISVLTNGALVALMAGLPGLALYTVFVAVLGLTLAEMLIRKKSIEKSAAVTLLAMALTGFLILAGYAQFNHLNLWGEISTYLTSMVDSFAETLLANSNLIDASEMEDWKRSLVLEFPSGVAIFSLIMVWLNIVILLKMNPNHMKKRINLDSSFFRKWKAPEYLVWPTIVSGFFILVNVGKASDVSLNVFKFLMTIYAIQGLSVFCYFFDIWKMKKMLRFLGYILPLVFMTPLVLSVGFFDLWFDFRNKFRQS